MRITRFFLKEVLLDASAELKKGGILFFVIGLRILEKERQTAPKSSYPNYRFVMSACLSAWKNPTPSGRIFVKLCTGELLKYIEKIRIFFKSNKTLYMRTYIYDYFLDERYNGCLFFFFTKAPNVAIDS